ncbi:CLUMA_CG016941, isoform A [Clunio marinus]|uniref:CLUMA_CG016941, isoform A n=1 Tax=Clunio marinus TaxID=568069 RepID=A0A1J1IUH9_9DIPT|nr:CLUMA_CG016941, isoform A [Clunio marinus]
MPHVMSHDDYKSYLLRFKWKIKQNLAVQKSLHDHEMGEKNTFWVGLVLNLITQSTLDVI